ncbi:ABC transporter substrate-binding protein [Streptomyces sp. ODS28]|uniref:ABC transporter substrate-binding protein n=1 Tax=Streptomyces sp. ODS28 TaxID=3136688 RepID=UPI0031E7379F
MSRVSMRRTRASVVALAAGALVLSACSSGGGGGGAESGVDQADAKKQQLQFAMGDDAASKGPATPVKGSRQGGSITMYQRDTPAHLDPAQIYVSDQGAISTLMTRRLTSYKKDASGKYTVVGDLATNSGKSSDGGKTWTYKLKDGVKWEDGSPITSTDLRHTFERQFADFIGEGPIYVQQWLADTSGTKYRQLLKGGPYGGKHLPSSLLETPDKKTIKFHFKSAHPDLPYALGMAGYGIVQKSKDTKQKYDQKPSSSGPYKVAYFKPGKGMKFVRNKEWDAKTDPVRHQFVDAYNVQFGVSYESTTKRLMSDSGQNKTAATFTNQVDASSIQAVLSDKKVKERTVGSYQPYVARIVFNMSRLKDKKVREAITAALPPKALVQAMGGSSGGEIASNYVSPTVAGHTESDPYGMKKHPQGDVPKAKKLLKEAGKTGMKLTFAHRNSPEWQKFSAAASDNLRKAGFNVQSKDLVTDTYYDQISKVKNTYDMYDASWGADWPSASTVVPPTLDGRQIQDGSSNYAHYNNPKMNKEMDRISKITNKEESAKEWAKLADKIQREDLPEAPLMYYKQLQLHGSKIGGVTVNDVLSAIDPTQLYVKK